MTRTRRGFRAQLDEKHKPSHSRIPEGIAIVTGNNGTLLEKVLPLSWIKYCKVIQVKEASNRSTLMMGRVLPRRAWTGAREAADGAKEMWKQSLAKA